MRGPAAPSPPAATATDPPLVNPADTTRGPRPHEVHGKDYYFVERSEFEKMIEENGFVEHAQFSGNCYGTSHKTLVDIQSTGQRPILDIDAQVRNDLLHCPKFQN